MSNLRFVGCALVALAAPVSAMGDWYSGDPYAAQTLWPQYSDNLSNSGQTRAMTFDNFTWTPGAGGGVVDVLGGHFTRLTDTIPFGTVDTAYWEIRTGMSAGNAGTLVAFGSGNVTSTVTAFVQGGWQVGAVSVDVPNFALAAGNYWFGLAIGSTVDAPGWFNASTNGVNGIGGPLGDDIHLYYQENSSFVSWNYVDGTGFYPPGSTGFDPSYWINEVPAPSSAVVVGFVALLAQRRRRS